MDPPGNEGHILPLATSEPQGTVSEAYTDGRWWPVTTLTAEVDAEKENS